MRLIDADTLLKKAQALLIFGGAEVVWAHDVMVAPTIDPIRAAGGCRCRECQRWQRFGEPLPDGTPADWGTCTRFLDPDSECEITTADGDFCSYGEPREAQDDG